MKIAQLIECDVEIVEHRAHDRMDVTRKVTRGLLAVSADGDLYRYNYTTRCWRREPILVES